MVKGKVWEAVSDENDWKKIRRLGEESAKKLGIKSEEDVYRIVSDFRKESD